MNIKPLSSPTTAFNLVTSLASYGVSLAVAIAYIPFLVRELGLAAYGMIALSFALVQYAAPLSATISATLNQRFVSTLSNPNRFKKVFSTAVSLCLMIALALTVAMGGLSLALDLFLNIPDDLTSETRLLFLATAGAFVFALASTPLAGVIFAHNAIYLLNFKQVVELLLRTLAVVVLIKFYSANLSFVALAIFISAIAGLILLWTAALYLRRDLSYAPRSYSSDLVDGIARTGGGVLMVQVGAILFLNSDLIIVNLVYGPDTAGAYSAAAQWAIVLRGLLLSVGATITAKVMLDYHSHQGAARTAGVAQAIRLLSAFAALPVGYVAGISPYLLEAWIGPDMAGQAATLTALALPTVASSVSVPIMAALLAADRVGWAGLGYLICGVAFVAAAASTAALLDWRGLDVAVVLGVFLVAKNYLIVIPRAASILGEGAGRSLNLASLYSFGWTLAAAVITRVFANLTEPSGFGALIAIGLGVSAIYGILVLATLPATDRQVLMSAVYRDRLHRGGT